MNDSNKNGINEALELIDQAFVQFVREIYGGRTPYAWQRRLVHELASTNRWPERLAAPTGAGKTMVIDVHVFLNALAGLATSDSILADSSLGKAAAVCGLRHLPRRLVITVNRRALVDDQYDSACALTDTINAHGNPPSDSASSLLRDVYQGLLARAGESDMDTVVPCRVVRLRGGEPVDFTMRDWRYHPTECQVICATPDMFASRLLFRGYGTSTLARSIEAGLFGYDTVLIADEAHLNRQMVYTAQSVNRLEHLSSDGLAQSVPPLQVVSTTATQADNAGSDEELCIGVCEKDLAGDPELTRRLTSPKPVKVVSIPASREKDFAKLVAEACVDAFTDKNDDAVVGCIVNSVAMASDVMKQMRVIMRARGFEKGAFERKVRGLVGPMRRYDKRQLLDGTMRSSDVNDSSLKDGLLLRAIKGDTEAVQMSELRCVVATQTLEVGIDADFSMLITELPSSSALVQRAGRVNRRGLRDEGPIVVFRHEDSSKTKSIYSSEELEAAWQWLQELPAESGLSAWGSVLHPPIPPRLPRAALQRLEQWDVENLSHTDEELGSSLSWLYQAASDVALWLRDDLLSGDELSNGLVVRQLPKNDSDAIGLLTKAQPVADEVFPIQGRGQIDEIGKRWVNSQDQSNSIAPFRVFIVRADEQQDMAVIQWRNEESLNDSIHPGDTLVVDDTATLFDRDLHIIAPKTAQSTNDVYNLCQSRGVILSQQVLDLQEQNRVLTSAIEDLRENLQRDSESSAGANEAQHKAKMDNTDDAEPMMLDLIKDDHARNVLVRIISETNNRFGCTPQDQQTFWQQYNADSVHDVVPVEYAIFPAVTLDYGDNPWLFVQLTTDAIADGEALQEIRSPRRHGKSLVYLNTSDGHQQSVAQRAERFMKVLDLPSSLQQDIAVACRHHDDGKKDLRFQELLHYRLSRPEYYQQSKYLAKSRYRSIAREAVVRRELNLQGWRHEQRSAAECWAERDALHAVDVELVTRLVGTSHGHGRSCFRDNAERLVPPAEIAAEQAMTAVDIERIHAAAEELFNGGMWECIVNCTNRRYGYWGVSYLEAIVRSADVTISQEGR